ncbi:ABC transporter permease [Bacillus pseudomycoides]|uniref:ABC transporter permease n=1 Tax=Bacillus pseudomycoides TaxID=64104 RepID=UPI000BFD97A6|nr:ABC transporter permease [Bacillus pseudomycoides]PGS05593.1 ABC transporter permease [Bacillus pseudomycoides]
MIAALRSELLKLKRKKLFLVVFLIQSLALLWLFAIVSQDKKEFLNWESLLSRVSMINALFLPIMIATITSRIIDFENKGNTWKLLCAIPTSRKLVYITKIIFSLFFLVYAGVIGSFLGYCGQMFPWKTWIIWTYSSLTNPISWAFSNGKIVYFPNEGVMMNLLLSLGVSLLFIVLSTVHFAHKDIH